MKEELVGKRAFIPLYEDTYITEEQINEWIDKMFDTGHGYPVSKEELETVLNDK